MVLSVGKRFLETQSLMRAVKDAKLFFQSQEKSWETFDKKIMQYKCFVTIVRSPHSGKKGLIRRK